MKAGVFPIRNQGQKGLRALESHRVLLGISYPLQYSCLENSKDRGAWWATVNGVAKRWTRLTLLQIY